MWDLSSLTMPPAVEGGFCYFFFNFFFNIQFIYFGDAGSSLLFRIFSSCGEQGPLSSCCVRASHRDGLLWSTGARALRLQPLSHVGSVAAIPGL